MNRQQTPGLLALALLVAAPILTMACGSDESSKVDSQASPISAEPAADPTPPSFDAGLPSFDAGFPIPTPPPGG